MVPCFQPINEVCSSQPGILEQEGCTNNACEARTKILDHAHFIKTTPIFIAQQAPTAEQTAPQTVWRVVLPLLPLTSYMQLCKQCISMAKHISKTAFYIVTLTIQEGCNPITPPPRSAPASMVTDRWTDRQTHTHTHTHTTIVTLAHAPRVKYHIFTTA